MGLINNEEYLFITTCSKTKSYINDDPIPLVEMYSGRVFKARYELMKTLSDEVYFCTPSGPGIVRDDWVTAPYNQMTPNSKLNSKEFQEMHRKLFEQRYPGRIEKVKKIFWLGSEHYDNFLKNVFHDKEVIICMDSKLPCAKLESYLLRLHEFINTSQTGKLKKAVWVENNDYVLVFETYKYDNSTTKNLIKKYKKVATGLQEDYDYSASAFARDLFGVDHQGLKALLKSECGYNDKQVSNIATGMLYKLFQKKGIEIHAGLPEVGTIKDFNPITEGYLAKEFAALM